MSEWGKLFWVQGKFHCCNWHAADWGSSAAHSVHQGHTSTVCAFVCVCLRDCVSVWGYQVAINGLVNGGHCLKLSLFSCYPVTALQINFHKMSLLLNEGRFYFHHYRAELSTACKPKKKEAPPVLLISIATHLPGHQATVVVVSIYVMDNFFSLLCNLRAAVAFFDRIMKILPGENWSINFYL